MAKAKKEEPTVKAGTKAEEIAAIKAKLEKDFGKGTIMGAREKPSSHEHISTGSLGLDIALGVGGLPKGRIIEIYGPESSGKTTMCLETIVQAHAADPQAWCAYIDVEHSLDLGYAAALGVDIDRLEISQPDYGEQALEVADRLISSGLFAVVVVDSVAALVPKKELEGEMGDAVMASQARLMSQALRKLTGTVNKSGTILIFTNQMRDKVGVMFGSPETTTGGNALKYYASIRLDVRRSITKENSVTDKNDNKIGNYTKVKVVKNKVAPPFRECTFDVLYGEGIDKAGELLDLAVDTEVVTKSGAFLSYNGDTIGQGRENTRIMLKDNPDLTKEIKEKVLATFKPKVFKATEKEVVDAI